MKTDTKEFVCAECKESFEYEVADRRGLKRSYCDACGLQLVAFFFFFFGPAVCYDSRRA